jgi:hypothetical protein
MANPAPMHCDKTVASAATRKPRNNNPAWRSEIAPDTPSAPNASATATNIGRHNAATAKKVPPPNRMTAPIDLMRMSLAGKYQIRKPESARARSRTGSERIQNIVTYCYLLCCDKPEAVVHATNPLPIRGTSTEGIHRLVRKKIPRECRSEIAGYQD